MKSWFSIFALATALTIGVFSPGSAHQVVVGKLKIGHPWVREAAEGAPFDGLHLNAAGYLIWKSEINLHVMELSSR
jgi:lysophospholipase L1-like esterase